MLLFDANVQVGRYRQLREGMPYSKDDLLKDMDRFGIAEALVLHSLSREAHLAPGNHRVLRTVEGEPRLHPCWAVVPARSGENGPLDMLLDRLYKSSIRAVKLFPGHYSFSLQEWCLGSLLEVLEEGRLVTFIDPNSQYMGTPMDQTNWDALVALCRAHPKLPVVLSESRLRSGNRMLYQAFETCPNLHLELSGFWEHRGIEFLCHEFGPERLLFGTKWPVRELGGTVAQLQYAEIGEAERSKIGGDNLRKLLAGAHPSKRRAKPEFQISIKPPKGETLRAQALRGDRPDRLIIDTHAHLGKSAIYHLPQSSPALVEQEMQRLGVRCSIVFGFSGVTGDWTYDNDLVTQAMRRHPGRYHGLIVVNPNHPGEMMQELERCVDRGFIGVKLIPSYQDYPEDGPNIELAVRWANEHRMIVLNHSWGPTDHLRRLAVKYPEVTFIIGHYTTQHAAVVNNYPNVYQCTCEPLTYNSVETLVDALDTSKIVFGSDTTDLPLMLGMGPILHARIPEEDKDRILGLNARDLLRKVGVRIAASEPMEELDGEYEAE
ncbi:amidohydrolase family protein [bacterium]|nr:amidohydrolase family protein [bacterium]